MLSWDEFDKEDPTEAKAAPAAAQAVAQGHDKLDDEAAGSVEEARAVSADDSDAVARAKKALNDLDIQEGLDDLEGSAARVQVGDKQMINARADLNQLV
ncbi:ribonucleotide-diphosphate reductase subunit beta, partial [Pseudomonas aeruginosa]